MLPESKGVDSTWDEPDELSCLELSDDQMEVYLVPRDGQQPVASMYLQRIERSTV